MTDNPYLEIWDIDYYSSSDEEDNDSDRESEESGESDDSEEDSGEETKQA